MGRRTIAIVAAVLLALVGVLAVVLYANGADQRAVAAAQPRAVFVTEQTVPAGTTLNDAIAGGLITQTSLPAKSVPAGALTAVTEDNKNLVALTDIAAGEYIQSGRFGTTPQGSQAIRVPSGQIAVSITLPEPAKVGTFIAPGSHIVLFDTVDIATGSPTSGAANNSGPRATRILFDDVLVIAVGTSALTAPTPASGTRPSVAQGQALVTLALNPEQAVRLVHAVNNTSNTLYAGLRGSDLRLDPALAVSDANVFNR